MICNLIIETSWCKASWQKLAWNFSCSAKKIRFVPFKGVYLVSVVRRRR